MYTLPCQLAIIQDMGREHFLKIPTYGAQCQKCIFAMKKYMAVAQRLTRITCPIRMVALLRSRVLKDELLPRWELGSTHTGFSTNYGILGWPPLAWNVQAQCTNSLKREEWTFRLYVAKSADMGAGSQLTKTWVETTFWNYPANGAQFQKCVLAMKMHMTADLRFTTICAIIRQNTEKTVPRRCMWWSKLLSAMSIFRNGTK